MKITSQLSIATIAMVGLIASGCSQQQVAGSSQVASPSQQVASPSQQSPSQQVASPSQQSPSQQSPSQQSPSQQSSSQNVVSETALPTPTVVEVAPAVKPMMPHKPMVQSGHVHPAIPGCTDSIRHNHRSNNTGHTHKYSCKGHHQPMKPMAHRPMKPVCAPCAKKPAPVRSGGHVHPAVPGCTDSIRHYHKSNSVNHKHSYSCKGQRAPMRHVAKPAMRHTNKWAHTHPAIPRCTDSVTHTHKYNARNHNHKYSCKGAARPMMPAPATRQPQTVDVFALQRKLKAKGYYRGAIDGVVGSGTREALQQYMQNR